jgi:phosphatidylglycerophosphate synthase
MTNNQAGEAEQNLRDQLRAAEAGGGGGDRLSRSAARSGGRFALTVGILVALYFLVVVYVYPQRNAWLNVIATAAFVVSMVGTVRWHERRRRASSLGWSKRYSAAFASTVGLYGAGIALLATTDDRAWWLWLPYAVLTALPLATAGLLRGAK